MKKYIFIFLVIALLFLNGCKREYVYLSNTTLSTAEENAASEYIPEETCQQPIIEVTTDESTTAEAVTEELNTEQVTFESENTEVDLTIEMPEKNGTMEVDASPDNKFIKAVSEERRIDSDKLVAVFSVPESGQNYVFEFKDEKNREADALKRVYLLNKSCEITGVAATASNEREGISSVENWFCMNVLIKEIIFPAVSEQF